MPTNGPAAREVNGPLRITVVDDTATVDTTRWQALARHALVESGIRGGAELQLLFVDSDEMSELNARFMGETGPTDVLSFPIDGPGAAPGPRLLGDVVICPDVARRYAVDHGRSFDAEVALLVVHGILHVLGMDHAEPDEARLMQSREAELLEGWR